MILASELSCFFLYSERSTAFLPAFFNNKELPPCEIPDFWTQNCNNFPVYKEV
jgi:hypothetical protein